MGAVSCISPSDCRQNDSGYDADQQTGNKSGATYSSRGIISAVKNALTGEKDSGKTAENPGQGQGSTTLAASMEL